MTSPPTFQPAGDRQMVERALNRRYDEARRVVADAREKVAAARGLDPGDELAWTRAVGVLDALERLADELDVALADDRRPHLPESLR